MIINYTACNNGVFQAWCLYKKECPYANHSVAAFAAGFNAGLVQAELHKENIERWRKEISEIDPDNESGALS